VGKFSSNEIISLIGPTPRYDLGESVGPDLSLNDVLGSDPEASLGDLALGYGTAQGDPRLRALIANAHGVSADDVVVTVGGMHALFLVAFVVCDPGDEAVVASPMFPLARTAAQRERSKDPRPAIAERYGSREDYLARARREAAGMVTERFLLAGDIDAVVERAAALWELIHTQTSPGE